MMRVGLGYDIHRLVVGRALVLGGVIIPHESGLEGHSDADVVLHAVMDAMLGACALPDIGYYFPPTDDRFAGASSLDLLKTVRQEVRKAGYRVANIDIVVVAERPRLASYRDAMRESIARALSVELSCVGLQATTNESVGPEGREEAISARAVTLVDQLT